VGELVAVEQHVADGEAHDPQKTQEEQRPKPLRHEALLPGVKVRGGGERVLRADV
jgi:hypothetical protein